MSRNQLFFLAASFVEGGCLMSYEILSSKLYTPSIGSSMYVWVSILTITLVGLAFGYRIGGYLTKQRNVKNKLVVSFLIAGVYIVLAPFISKIVLPHCLDFEIEVSTLIAGLIILFIPVLFLGTISPLIINEINQDPSLISKTTGLIFGFGTIGGIIFLLSTAYLFIPTFGVKLTTQFVGFLLIIEAFILFIHFKMSKNG